MRIERLSQSEFTIFLTFEDLIERGFTKDDLWHDASDVKSLFSDMVQEASTELGMELEGMLLVNVHLMQAQGMHIVVTQKSEDTNWDEDFIEMKVTLDESQEMIFSFAQFEHIIQLAPLLAAKEIYDGVVYYMDNRYYMMLTEQMIHGEDMGDVIAVMSEFGSPSIVTSHRLQEYGKVIYDSGSTEQIINVFLNK